MQENAALCDQVAHMQENLMLVKEERLFLLRKLCQQQGEMESNSMIARSQSNNMNSPSFNPECATTKKTVKKRVSTDGTGTLLRNVLYLQKCCIKTLPGYRDL
jgi:hypothetical protein